MPSFSLMYSLSWRKWAATLRHYTAVARGFDRKSRSAFVKAASETLALSVRLYAGDRSGTLPAPTLPLDTNKCWFENLALTLVEYLVSTASAEDYHEAFTAVADGLQRVRQQHHTRQIIQFQAMHALALHFSWYHLGLLRVTLVSGSHDLDAVFVEDIQDVLVERSVELYHGLWVVTVDVEFVGHGEVTQGLLEHERRRLLEQSRDTCCGWPQHRLDTPDAAMPG